ncbi:hypothetical protein GTQ40_12625 [Flavobacteriaceae bacterium R38]|nr:hypothetical protein [Flavobacteriaceae bacterium R38]
METTNKPPKSFILIGILALLWNLIGVFFYLSSAYMPDEVFETFTQAQQDFMNNTPAWATAAFAIAVFAGTLGAIGLLLKKKWCITLFTLSLLAAIAQNVYGYILSNGYEVNGPSGLIVPTLVILIGLFLISYSRKAKANGWVS